jgi:hypothetical protein
VVAQRELATEAGTGQVRVVKCHGGGVASHHEQAKEKSEQNAIHDKFSELFELSRF